MSKDFSNLTPEFKKLLTKYETPHAALIPILSLIQTRFGHICPDLEQQVAGFLNIPLVKVREVLTFYTMYFREPKGKHLIQVCTNVSCALADAENIVNHLCGKLNIEVGQTTVDRKFTLLTVECLGSCGTAPAMMVNDRYYEGLTPDKVDRILETLQ